MSGSCLIEKWIFLVHNYLFINGANSFGKLFSLLLALSSSRSILMIGSIGIGWSYLVKYLVTNPYVYVSFDRGLLQMINLKFIILLISVMILPFNLWSQVILVHGILFYRIGRSTGSLIYTNGIWNLKWVWKN